MYQIKNKIDNFINNTTMYRLVLYYLIVLIVFAMLFGLFKLIPFTPFEIASSTFVIVAMSWITNKVFSNVFKASVNVESFLITALILVLIVSPMKSLPDLLTLIWVSVLSMSSKYILSIRKKHIFNPAAIAVVATAIFAGQSASWWVGNIYMTPIVLIGGLYITKKVRREDMVFTFITTIIMTVFAFTIAKGGNVFSVSNQLFFHSSLLFFAFVMLTEPMTAPAIKSMQIVFGMIVGLLFVPDVHVANFYFTPELALIIGNIFSYLVNPKYKLILSLKEKILLSENIYDFVFTKDKGFKFIPGQYLELTLPHPKSDDRGNRRYFTIASSPTEDEIRFGVKFNNPSSSYKKEMLNMSNKSTAVASELAGDFTLPKNVGEKLVFIAGGIGITPFRSMIKYLIDKGEKRDIVLMYSNKTVDEIVYANVFKEAVLSLGIKVYYILTDVTKVPSGWDGISGRLTGDMLVSKVPDFYQRTFYLSGPQVMVNSFEKILKEMGVKSKKIKKDFFPGF